MPMRHSGTVASILLAGAAALVLNAPIAAHDEDLEVCRATDSIGEFSFPIGGIAELRNLCAEVDGARAIGPAPPAEELIRWMYDLGFYDPYWLAPLDIEDFFPVESPAP